ncbi:MAG: inositol 2-dehydrogenase [Pseudomonadota bacterium]
MRIAVLGLGRIGLMHAGNIARHHTLALAGVHDLDRHVAVAAAETLSTQVYAHLEAVFADEDAEALLIATPTDTHADLIERAVECGKAVFCEKPVDLSLRRASACAAAVAGRGVPVQIGFNRRFDPGHRGAREALRAGEIGALHQVLITSRDPGLPPREYLMSAGGLLRDMTIHDFDLARFLLPSEPVEVYAVADALVDPALGKALGEVDSAMLILRTADGCMCHINNSRAAVYGYDQRVELLGDEGMLVSDNRRPHELRRYGARATGVAAPYLHFFIERYHDSFVAELEAFAQCVADSTEPEVGLNDGVAALRLAEAAYLSMRERRAVSVDEVELA